MFAFRLSGRSPGTDDMVRRPRAAGIPVYLVRKEDALDGLSSGTIDALGHQVNLKGVMAAGIAKLGQRWPWAYDPYRKAVLGGRLRLGGILPVEIAPGAYVVHLAAQRDIGTETRQTDYLALATALRQLAHFYEVHQLRPGLPWSIGCGLGGGEWDRVLRMVLHTLPHGVTFFVRP